MILETEKSLILSKLPNETRIIFNIFGDNIRLVGGCVRDLLLNHQINDFDFACIFEPKKVQDLLLQNNIRSIPTGLKHGTITALVGKFQFQITTLRRDIQHFGRNCEVAFTDDFIEDAKRRDFTINALYLDRFGNIYDYFNGINDLNNKRVCFIGDPKQRIQEDSLRILRFFRFSSYFSKNLDEQGLQACIDLKESLKIISKERVRDEFCKILKSPDHQQLNKILQLINHENFDQILWQSNIDNLGFERLLNFTNLIPQKNLFLSKITTIFVNSNFDKKLFYENFRAKNFEKKFIQLYQNFQNELMINNFDLTKINLFLIEFSKDILVSFFVIFFAKNPSKHSENDLENIISYIINKPIPLFPITINDLIAINCPKNKLSKVLKKLKILWAKNDFKISSQDILKSYNLVNDLS
ncbi:MAG: CCA tRNA nucleotidyltransferase [Alphaproteobacteria bacterium]|nr:CCA tRNA nucleotidyltransferase [Alphaproteobacteria bacterium]